MRRRNSKRQTDNGDPNKNDEGERTAKQVHPIQRANKHNTESHQGRERQGKRNNTEIGTRRGIETRKPTKSETPQTKHEKHNATIGDR